MSSSVLASTIAGSWYPGDPARLKAMIGSFLGPCPAPEKPYNVVVVPHAGYPYSGPTAGYAYAALDRKAAIFTQSFFRMHRVVGNLTDAAELAEISVKYEGYLDRQKAQVAQFQRSEDLLLPEDPDLYVYTRELDGHKLLVVCNFSESQREFFPDEEFREGTVLIQNNEGCDIFDGRLEPYEAYVLYI